MKVQVFVDGQELDIVENEMAILLAYAVLAQSFLQKLDMTLIHNNGTGISPSITAFYAFLRRDIKEIQLGKDVYDTIWTRDK